MPLFAQADPGISPWYAAPAAAVLLGFWEFIKWAAGEWRSSRAERDKAAATGRDAYIAHLEGLVVRQAQVIEAKDAAAVRRDAECDRSTLALSNFRVFAEGCLGHNRLLAALLDMHKIEYPRLEAQLPELPSLEPQPEAAQ